MSHITVVGEFWQFLRQRKKYWLLPIVILLLLLGLVVVLTANSALAPFIWVGKAKFWLAVPTSVFGMTLIPIAYCNFFLMMNSKSLLGENLKSRQQSRSTAAMRCSDDAYATSQPFSSIRTSCLSSYSNRPRSPKYFPISSDFEIP